MTAVRPFLSPVRQRQIDRAIASRTVRTRRFHRQPTETCAVLGCDRPARTRGLCRTHYKGWWKATRTGRAPRMRPIGPVSRFDLSIDAERCGSECDLAWLARLLEGEGTFSINGIAENRYPRISVDMCSEPVIRRAAGILGSLSVRPREPRDERWRVTYFTAVTGARASEWMRRLRPLMGARRTAAIDAALAAYKPIRLVDPPRTCVVP